MRASFKNKTVLITGGSSGIGLDLAELFLRDDSDLIIVGSNPEKLKEAVGRLEKKFDTKILAIAKDLSSPQAPSQVLEAIGLQNKSVDVLVNSAGFGVYGKFYEASLSSALNMIDVNVKALVAMCHLVIPNMIKNRYGAILNIGSTAGFQGLPVENVYGATKSFVIHFTEALNEELRSTGVWATCLCPGSTDTPFFSRGQIHPSQMMKINMMKSDVVAQVGFRALQNKKTLAIPGFVNKSLIFTERFVPRIWTTKIAGFMVR